MGQHNLNIIIQVCVLRELVKIEELLQRDPTSEDQTRLNLLNKGVDNRTLEVNGSLFLMENKGI